MFPELANRPGTSREASGKEPGRVTGKEIALAQAPQGFTANSSACTKKYELSEQGSASKAMPLDSLSMELEDNTHHAMSDPSAKINPIPDRLGDWMAKMERDHQKRLASKSGD